MNNFILDRDILEMVNYNVKNVHLKYIYFSWRGPIWTS